MVGATGGEDRLAAVHLSVVQHVCVSCMPVLQTYISLCLTFMLSVLLFLVAYDMHCTGRRHTEAVALNGRLRQKLQLLRPPPSPPPT